MLENDGLFVTHLVLYISLIVFSQSKQEIIKILYLSYTRRSSLHFARINYSVIYFIIFVFQRYLFYATFFFLKQKIEICYNCINLHQNETDKMQIMYNKGGATVHSKSFLILSE